MIKIVAHLSDIHIRKNPERHAEYREVFEKLYKKLEEQKPDRIVIAGDLYHDFIDLEGEAEILMGEFLNRLSQLTDKVIIIRGNHDMRKKQKKRKDVVETITTLINNPKIIYYNKSDFYVDDNVVWVVHHHLEGVNPWYDIQHTKDNTKIYIDLYHDPIQGCKGHNGYPLKNKKYKTSDLKGDFGMIGDIHLHQVFDDKIVYPGSLIGQDFGEPTSPHGYLLWDLSIGKFDYIELPNPHNYINFTIKEGTDYNNLNLEHELLNPLSNIKIKWNDISANINFENEVKLRNYFKHAHHINNIKIEKNAIYTDVSGVKMINESVDVLNPSTQRDIFIEYLETNGYKKEFIDEILKIDDIINDRLNVSLNKGITWGIDKVFFNNFKSYGDDIEVDFSKMDTSSIIQINGINQQGKTTILDTISYILYGKTTTTTKREKNGDNRYINNKRDLNYCNGGAVITINDEVYTVIRTTERKWNKSKTEISSCSSNVDYYIGTDISEENKLTGERRTNTQKLIDDSIGDFDDFIRLVLTNADNLNSLLSLDRSVFIDSITRDAGYDIFEKKLEEFKNYRKEITKNRISIDIQSHNDKIEEINLEKIDIELNLENINNDIEILEDSKPSIVLEKEKIIESLEKIDESLYNFDIEDVNKNINEENDKINKRELQLKKIEEIKEEIKDYDNSELIQKTDKLSEIKDIISIKKSNLKDFDIKISQLNNKVSTINSNIKDIVNDYITDLKIKISDNDTKIYKLKDEFNSKITNYKSDLKDKVNKLEIDKNNFSNDVSNYMEQGKTLKQETTSLIESLDHVCITCHRHMDDDSRKVVNSKINDNRKIMLDLMDKVQDLKVKITELTNEIGEINNKLDMISKKDYSFDNNLNESFDNTLSFINEYKSNNEEIEKIIELIRNNNYPLDLKSKLLFLNEDKSEVILEISRLEDDKVKLNREIEDENDKLDLLNNEVKLLKEEEEKYQKKKESIQLEDRIKLDIEKSNNLIERYNNQIDNYNKELHKIEKNKELKEKIDKLTLKINTIEKNIKETNTIKNNIEKDIHAKNIEIQKYKDEIKIFEKQKKQDEILDSYMKCVHRDGLPSFLLKKSIHIINQELNNILTDVDFTLFFDEDLNLKLSHDIRMDIAQNAIESSGMERTFCAIALKIALRKINNKSKPNLILLDELFGKLVERSVEKLINLLDVIKNEVDKLIIIEHVNPLNYDYLIEVNKDDNGISDLKIEY